MTTKIEKRKVMNSAWMIFRAYRTKYITKDKTFADALAQAWRMEKKLLKKEMIEFSNGVKIFHACFINEKQNVGKVSASAWEKDGKCRVYFKVYFENGRWINAGYYDVQEKTSYTKVSVNF